MAKGKRREELRPSVAPGGLLLPAHTESAAMQQLQRHSGGPDTPFRGWTGFVSSLLDTAGAVVDAAINRATQLLARNEEREGGAAVMHEAMGKDLKDEAVMKELVERFEVLDDGEDAALLPSVSGGEREESDELADDGACELELAAESGPWTLLDLSSRVKGGGEFSLRDCHGVVGQEGVGKVKRSPPQLDIRGYSHVRDCVWLQPGLSLVAWSGGRPSAKYLELHR